MEYTFTSIYGYYIRQEKLINGRPWYKNDGRSIWWDDKTDRWKLFRTGLLPKKVPSASFAYLDNNKGRRCLSLITQEKWKFGASSHPDHSNWYNAGNNLKIRCGHKPIGINTTHFMQHFS